MKQKMGKVLLPLAFIVGSCVTVGYTTTFGKPQEDTRVETVSQLEAMTAAGEFFTIAAYVHQQIDQHPDQYMDELYDGARVALKHAPNGVYELAIDQYAEDVHEYMETRIYTMQQMQKNAGFAFGYDVNYDE